MLTTSWGDSLHDSDPLQSGSFLLQVQVTHLEELHIKFCTQKLP